MFKSFRTFLTFGILMMSPLLSKAATVRYTEIRSTLQPNTTGQSGVYVGTGTVLNLNTSTVTFRNGGKFQTLPTGPEMDWVVNNSTAIAIAPTAIDFSLSNNLYFEMNSARMRPQNDNMLELGAAGQRWQTVYSSNAAFTNITASGTWTMAGSTVALTNTVINGTKVEISTTLAGSRVIYNGDWVFGGTTSIKGVTSGVSKPAGSVGEYISSAAVLMPFGTSNQYFDVAQIVLTPGDWEISCFISAVNNGASVTDIEMGIGTSPGNTSTGIVEGDTDTRVPLTVATGGGVGGAITPRDYNITTTTTYYLKTLGTYTVATPKVAGRISARRM